jgi:hypothetical protein
MLQALWIHVVKPILDTLAIPMVSIVRLFILTSELTHPRKRSELADSLPRITWCGAGPLAFLPFHAAGLYHNDDAESRVYNYVVSSYSPTISALLPQSSTNPEGLKELLAVSQSSDLPGTTVEVQKIKHRMGDIPIQCLNNEDGSVEAVLQGMKTHGWVHLACHAHQDPVDPTNSAFKLHDGSLALSTMMKHTFKHAEFAFLSACQTATGDDNLPDEAIHLAAGMLFAGYKTVIGTMWSIEDNYAPMVADEVYSYIVDSEAGVIDSTKAAYGLHRALCRLRKEVGEQAFATWVPFVHFGL